MESNKKLRIQNCVRWLKIAVQCNIQLLQTLGQHWNGIVRVHDRADRHAFARLRLGSNKCQAESLLAHTASRVNESASQLVMAHQIALPLRCEKSTKMAKLNQSDE